MFITPEQSGKGDNMKELVSIQAELKAPKNQVNTFGNYNYRSTEGILEAVKPLLLKYNATMSINDDVVAILDRVYVKSTVKLTCGDKTETVSAFAREADTKKGMDSAQITGAASSYARKYALSGMFLIDDNKDPDSDNNEPDKVKNELPQAKNTWVLRIEACKTAAELQTVSNDAWHWAKTPAQKTEISNCKDAMKLKLGIK